MTSMKLIAFAGYSGSGKTTLIEKVIPCLVAWGYRVSLVKHAHHDFDIDHPGKDSWRHRQAGATEVLVTSSRRWALIHELRDEDEPDLESQLKHLQPCDLVIVEGWKHHNIAKIEVHRKESGRPLLLDAVPGVVAVATDEALDTPLPQLDVNDAEAVAHFICQHLGLHRVPLHLVTS